MKLRKHPFMIYGLPVNHLTQYVISKGDYTFIEIFDNRYGRKWFAARLLKVREIVRQAAKHNELVKGTKNEP